MAERYNETETEQWMRMHPDDVPCPNTHYEGVAWRRKRGIGWVGESPRDRAIREKYKAAMAEKRAAIPVENDPEAR